jgi:hypothetical protein
MMKLPRERLLENKTRESELPSEQATAMSSFVLQYARGELVSRDSRGRPPPIIVSPR